MFIEATPPCAFNNNGEHYEIPENVLLDRNNAHTAEVHYTNHNLSDFYSMWLEMHKYPEEICFNCLCFKNCSELWKETYSVFGVEGLLPYFAQRVKFTSLYLIFLQKLTKGKKRYMIKLKYYIKGV